MIIKDATGGNSNHFPKWKKTAKVSPSLLKNMPFGFFPPFALSPHPWLESRSTRKPAKFSAFLFIKVQPQYPEWEDIKFMWILGQLASQTLGYRRWYFRATNLIFHPWPILVFSPPYPVTTQIRRSPSSPALFSWHLHCAALWDT